MTALIKYAGYDHGELNAKASQAYAQFLTGKDTVQIAASMRVREYVALKLVNIGRCELHGWPSPYERGR